MNRTSMLLAALACAGCVLSHPRAGRADDDAGGGDAKTPSRVIEFDGEPAVRLDARTRQRNAITVAVLPSAPWQDQVRGYGMVLDPTALADTAQAIVAARARTAASQARLAASKTAFDRARLLYRGQQNVSLAQLQAAEATWRTDQAGLDADSSQSATLANEASLRFGPVLGADLIDADPLVAQLLERRQLLVQVTLPPGVDLALPPATAMLHVPGRTQATIALLSPASRTDPAIQGTSFLYLAPAASGVLPGMNVLVSLPAGRPVDGVAVPPSAIIWWQGFAWIYREAAPDMFVRTRIATDLASGDGGSIVRGLGRTPIVTGGAQQLLSEEFRAQLQSDDD